MKNNTKSNYYPPIPEHKDILRHLKDQNGQCFFLTATFLSADPESDSGIVPPNKCFDAFEQLYVRTLSELLNHYTRKRHLHPLVYAYLDYPFTKKNKTYAHLSDLQKMKRNKRLAWGHPELTPHIHAMMSVHPDVVEKFKKLIPSLEPLFRSLRSCNRTLDIKELATGADVAGTLHYSQGLVRECPKDLKETDLFIVLPKAKSEAVYVRSDWEKELEQQLAADRVFRARNVDNWRAGYFG